MVIMRKRSSIFDAASAEELCRKVAAGSPLLRVCAEPGMPSVETVYKLCRTETSFRERLERARNAGVRLRAAVTSSASGPHRQQVS
jgi:hypothetical protein